jgi:hypothetical protein
VSKLPDLPDDQVKAEHRLEPSAEMRAYYTQLARLDTVAFRIRVANRECRQEAPASAAGAGFEIPARAGHA